MQKQLTNGKEIFILALTCMNISDVQSSLPLLNELDDNLAYEQAEKFSKQAGLNAFSPDLWKQASEMINLHAQHQIKVIPKGSEHYPESLLRINNPPKILFAKGNLELLQTKRSLSIVGTRLASDYSMKVTERVAAHFTKENYVVVSGLAKGIDSIAHSSCLANNGKTIAILAHGLHRVYPTDNTSLAHLILDKGGLWISEHPLGVEPEKHFFVMRNRIQVGLSMFSIIIEAKKKSGTMSHADYCLKAKHPLYIVLPQKLTTALESSYEGNLWLYEKKGAIPLRSSLDYPKM